MANTPITDTAFLDRNYDRNMPQNNQFYVIPRYSPHLRTYIERIKWNCVGKFLEMSVAETPAFTAYRWFSGINLRRAEASKSAFYDTDKDVIFVCFPTKDRSDELRIKFRSLELIDHSCECDEFTQSSFLIHKLKIRYDECEIVDSIPEKVNEQSMEGLEEWMNKIGQSAS